MRGPSIISILGKCCSGKDEFAKLHFPNAKIIDIGNIVRGLVREQARTHNKRLANNIINELRFKIMSCEERQVVVTGIRQKEIYDSLVELTSDLSTYWLEVPESTLKRRYEERKHIKDTGLTFESVLEKDAELGLAELEEHVKSIRTTKIYKNTIKINGNSKDAVQKRQKVKAPKVVSRG